MAWFPRSTAKVYMTPGCPIGETNGLYAAVLLNTNMARPVQFRTPRPTILYQATKSPAPMRGKRGFV